MFAEHQPTLIHSILIKEDIENWDQMLFGKIFTHDGKNLNYLL